MDQYTVNSAAGRWILAATTLVSGMPGFLGMAVGIALPTIQKALDTSIAGMQWVFNAYALVIASLILISGSLGDHFGRRRIFNLGIFVFAGGSILASLSQSTTQLILAQAVIGLGAVMLIPASLAILNVSFVSSERGKAIGWWAAWLGPFVIAGQAIGGFLLQIFGWRSIYFVNIPVGILAYIISLRYVPESKNPEGGRIDKLGTFLLSLGLFAVSFGLIRGPLSGWTNSLVILSLILGVGVLVGFVLLQLRAREPLIPLAIFRDQTVVGANLTTFFLYFALNGVFIFAAIYLQQQYGYSPLAAGAGLAPPILLVTLFSGPFGSLADRIGPRLPLIVGTLLSAVGIGLLVLPGFEARYWVDFLPALVVLGAGMMIFVSPITKSALAVEDKYSGVASGVNNAVARISSLMAVAILGAIMATVFRVELKETLAGSALSINEQQQMIDQANKVGGLEIPESFADQALVQGELARKNSLAQAFRWVMGVSALSAFLSMIIAVLSIKKITKPPDLAVQLPANPVSPLPRAPVSKTGG